MTQDPTPASAPFPVRFDEARGLAFGAAREVAAEGFRVLLVRDVIGRFSLVVDDKDTPVQDEQADRWKETLSGLGAYRTDRPVVRASQLFSAAALLNSPRAVPDPAGARGAGSVLFLDNTVVGEDWANVSTPEPAPGGGTRPYRIALYGFKGGVGRTTAMSMLARAIADRGHCVLVVDLDLESPGAGPLLVGRGLPPYGVVDQMVESAVGNAEGLEIVTRSSYSPSYFGELWVAPARGSGRQGVPYSYVDKLNRVYADTPGASFADRLEQAVVACEDAVERIGDSGRRPDVVLLDSRAGIHDVAAVTISRLSDLALLFGANNDQTWEGYGDLFAAWQASGQAGRIEEKLRMVASMVPDSVHYPMEKYLEAFRERAFGCFSVLYGEVAPDETSRRNDESAPHWAIPILFEPGLVGMDAANAPDWQQRAFVQAAYRDFLTTVRKLVEPALVARGDREGP